MKKVFLLGVTLLATFSLTGCEMIENLLKGGQDLINEIRILNLVIPNAPLKLKLMVKKKKQLIIHIMQMINFGITHFQRKIEQ